MKPASALQPLERGQGLVEYALILVLVSVVTIVILSVAGQSVADTFCSVATALNPETTCAESSLQEGDRCVQYVSAENWHYIWEYQDGAWVRIAEPGGGPLPLCDGSDPNNGTRPGQPA